MRFVPSGAIAVVLVAGLVLAGCGGPQDPKPLEGQENAQDNGPDDTGDEQGDDSGDDGGSSDDDEGATPDDDNGDGQRIEQQEDDVEPLDAKAEAEVKKTTLQFSGEYDRMVASGDTAGVKKSYTDECEHCRRAVSDIEELYRRGGHYEGGKFLNPKVKVWGREDDGRIRVSLIGKSEAYKALDSSGKVLEGDVEKQDNQQYWLRKTEQGWKLVWWT